MLGTPAPCVLGCKVRNALNLDLSDYLSKDPIFGGQGLNSARVHVLTWVVCLVASPLLWIVVLGMWGYARWAYIAGLAEATLLLGLLVPIFWEYYILSPHHWMELWAFNILDMITPLLLLWECLPCLCGTYQHQHHHNKSKQH